MIVLNIRIQPEPELFHHLEKDDEILNYCTGNTGLLIYTNKSIHHSDSEFIDYHHNSHDKILEIIDRADKKIVSFDCDCLKNPPSAFRKLVQSFNGNIIDPIQIKNNLEYVSIIFDSDKERKAFTSELTSQIEFEILNFEVEKDRLLYLVKSNFDEMTKELTLKQREILLTAWKEGYYRIPRLVTSEKLASDQKISRYAIEKKLRIAENKLMDKMIPILLLYG